MPRPGTPAGVGLGLRPELAADLLRAPECVGFLEVVAESCFAQPAARREACAMAEILPVVPHGVKLSLGSAQGIDRARARSLGRLARDLGAAVVSEHVAFTRAGGAEIGHLTSLPFTRDAVRVVARNVTDARRALPDVPLLLENVAWTFRWPEDEMTEGDFYAEIVAATGCPLLLDVANLYANAVNSGVVPARMLADYPLPSVGMIHVAGGVLEHGFFLDTHAHPVSEAVFDLVARALHTTGPVPLVLERDQDFPAFEETRGELARLASLLRAAPAPRVVTPKAAARPAPADTAALAHRQAEVASMLTAVAPPGDAARPFGRDAVARTRAVLERKRVDEALPLLPHLAAAGSPARRLALDVVRAAARPESGAGIADAWRIADAAMQDPALADAARRDRIELRTRFVRRGAAFRPRRGPFLGSETLPGGSRVWGLKGPGREAPTRLMERGGRR